MYVEYKNVGGLLMGTQDWCEHDEKISKYTTLNYECNVKSVILRIQSWFCPECGVHGAKSEIVDPLNISPTYFRN